MLHDVCECKCKSTAINIAEPVAADGIPGLYNPSKPRPDAGGATLVYPPGGCDIRRCGYLSRSDPTVEEEEIGPADLSSVPAGFAADRGHRRDSGHRNLSHHTAENTNCFAKQNAGKRVRHYLEIKDDSGSCHRNDEQVGS